MTLEQENLSDILMQSVVNDATTAALIEFGESVFDDAVIQSEILTKVPVISTIVGLTKGVLNIRDRLYIKKLVGFLSETSKATKVEREAYSRKIEEDLGEANRAGEAILVLIEKVTSVEKAVMIGKVFRAFMKENDKSFAQLLYLSEIIERAYLQDLVSLRDSEIHNESNLEAVGIRKPIRHEDINIMFKGFVDQLKERTKLITDSDNPGIPDPEIQISGFTDAGYNLIRILRSYK